ncbi:hypothetical protein [Halorussus sp. MSC15.2]|uniref:hypothetical protein n=1 Tax=Halorussus sp. MSC15.2 TaxID=2283638 RepID=UPI0013D58555|nr:hypothetical protein [Halorussus sp. MSC15.2]NEU55767.1 hypothetical protein [Halorussus sp. MSC15.2]
MTWLSSTEGKSCERSRGIDSSRPRVSGDFVVLSAAILSTGAIVAGATPMTSLSGVTE